MKQNSAMIAALDIGGTKIAAGLVDPASGKVTGYREVSTEAAHGGLRVAQTVARLIADMTYGNPQVIAISICEIVDRTGIVRSRSSFDWIALNLQDALQTKLPIHLVADVRAAALAEARFGAAKDIDHALYISVGTGISSTLLINGVPYAGAHGAALVLATAEIERHCEACGAITQQSLEHVASGAGLAQLYGKGVDAKEIIRRAEANEAIAKALVYHATRQLGHAIAQLANCTDPQAIIVGGGLGSADGLYWTLLRTAIESGLWKDRIAEPRISRSPIGSERGVIGAALAATAQLH